MGAINEPHDIVCSSDFSTNECGDIVIACLGPDYISFQKEGCGTMVLSLATFMKMFNKWRDYREELEGLEDEFNLRRKHERR